MCPSGIGPCLLPANENWEPLRPAILYGIDSRAAKEIDGLTERYGEKVILERSGSPLTTQAVGPKLAWLKNKEPEVWEKMCYFLNSNSFIVQRLTGEYVLDHHSASQCDPLYDIHENCWIEEWAEEIAPGLRLPRLLWPSEIAGEINEAASSATGIPTGTPVAAGTIDAWAEAGSVGVREPGDLMLMYGSTMFIIEMVEEPLTHPKLWATAGLFPGTHNLAAGMATSGAVTGWFKDMIGDISYEELTQEATGAPPGSDGLVVLPYFAGERTPLYDPKARGTISGLTLSHGRGHVYRSLLEATAYSVRHILEFMRDAGGGGQRLVAVGGGTKGGLWTQIVSDAIGRPQELPEEIIGASYGDALLAGIASGLVNPGTDWSRLSETVEPNVENQEIYEDTYGVYRELYPATSEQVHKLAEMQKGGGGVVV